MELLELRTQRIDYTQLIGNGYDLDNTGLDGGQAGVMKLIIQMVVIRNLFLTKYFLHTNPVYFLDSMSKSEVPTLFSILSRINKHSSLLNNTFCITK
jgi:hypothetical protein